MVGQRFAGSPYNKSHPLRNEHGNLAMYRVSRLADTKQFARLPDVFVFPATTISEITLNGAARQAGRLNGRSRVSLTAGTSLTVVTLLPAGTSLTLLMSANIASHHRAT